jgi:site-specific recombinase XerD
MAWTLSADGREPAMSSTWMPCLVRSSEPDVVPVQLGDEVIDGYLRFVWARARRNTLLAVAFDLKVFFTEVAKPPVDVTVRDVLGFIESQRRPIRGGNVIRLEDGEAGLSARTIRRRLSSLAGLFDYLVALEVMAKSPVPRGLGTRSGRRRGVPLVRSPRTLPRGLCPEEVDVLVGALRTWRERAMVFAMLLGGLRRCEVLGLDLVDVNAGERRVFIADGKGGHQRITPISARFFEALAYYLNDERPETSTGRVFVVLKGRRRGEPLSAAGLDEILRGARRRGGLAHATCHELRHTCLTRLREAGMALEAVQAQAGHRSIESTRIYLHLANGWLSDEYHRAIEAIDTAGRP